MPEQSQIVPPLFSQNLKTKGKTYYFDVKAAKNGGKYVTISELWTSKDGQKHRGNLTVFGNELSEFIQSLQGMEEKVKS